MNNASNTYKSFASTATSLIEQMNSIRDEDVHYSWFTDDSGVHVVTTTSCEGWSSFSCQSDDYKTFLTNVREELEDLKSVNQLYS